MVISCKLWHHRRMKKSIYLALLFISISFHGQAQDSIADAKALKQLYTTALKENQGYNWLSQLTTLGSRLTGSPQATDAVLYFKNKADSLGFKTQLQEVKVPQWVRGPKEVAYYTVGEKTYYMRCTALGGSVATPDDGLQAPIVEITSFEQLDGMTDELKGKVAFFNIPMDPSFINTFFSYSTAVKQRYAGAVEASKKGAIAVVSRSLSATVNEYPHTGSMTYKGALRQIPSMAISTVDAELLSQHLKQGSIDFYMRMHCQMKDSVTSYNLIADLPGRTKPDEIILIGGHIDSWDLGTGAHDDGSGCIHSLEAAWLLKKTGLMPSRTVRVVFFMNEEFGLNGARVYAAEAAKSGVKHAAAMESDAGGFTPRGISIVAPDAATQQIRGFRNLLEPYGVHQFSQTGSGADIGELYTPDLVMIGLRPDNHRYFEIHHSAKDVLESVNPRELEMGSATMAALIYLLDKYDIVQKF